MKQNIAVFAIVLAWISYLYMLYMTFIR